MWYYAVNGQTLGPISEADLDAQVRHGSLPASTLVWREGLPAWVPYDARPGRDIASKSRQQNELAPIAAIDGGVTTHAAQGTGLRLESTGSWAMLAVMLIAMFGFLGVLSSRPRIADEASAIVELDDEEIESSTDSSEAESAP